jgi:hypothetical protein
MVKMLFVKETQLPDGNILVEIAEVEVVAVTETAPESTLAPDEDALVEQIRAACFQAAANKQCSSNCEDCTIQKELIKKLHLNQR